MGLVPVFSCWQGPPALCLRVGARAWARGGGSTELLGQQGLRAASTPGIKMGAPRAAAGTAEVASGSESVASPEPSASSEASPSSDLDAISLLVGRVLRCHRHPDADNLLVEEVDCAEEGGPRTICSGLAQYLEPTELEGKLVVVLANLKPRNMRGVKSAGMLLCASHGADAERAVRPLEPHPESAVGERIGASDGSPADLQGLGTAMTPNQLGKKKAWEAVQPFLSTNAQGVATYKEALTLQTSAGPVTCASLPSCGIS